MNGTEYSLDDPVILEREIKQIKSSIDRLTFSLVGSLESKYIELDWPSDEIMALTGIRDLVQNIGDLENRLVQQKTQSRASQIEIERLCNELKECSIAYEYAASLVDFENKVNKFISLCDEDSFWSVAQLALELRSFQIGERTEPTVLNILQIVKEDIVATLDASNYSRTVGKWNEIVVFSAFEPNERCKTVALSIVENQKEVVENVLKALCVYNDIDEYVARFSKTFLTEILKPCINFTTEIKTKLNSLHLDVEKESRKSAEQALQDVQVVLKFFSQNFRFDLLNETDGNFISQVGKIIAQDMLSYIIDEQLEPAVPSKRKDMPAYLALVEKVNGFREFLGNIGFLPEGNSLLCDYSNDIDGQIRNKMTANYFARARKICSYEIHDMFLVEPNETDEAVSVMDLSRPLASASVRQAETSSVKEVSSNLFLFPRCQVSKHVIDLLKLVHEILNEAACGDYSEKDLIHLYSVAVDIVDIYPQFVGLVHKKQIESLSLIPALVHNNCFYLAHKLITIGATYENHHFRFVDLVPKLRNSGVQVLDAQASKQKDIIVAALTNAGLSSLSEYDQLPETVGKHINQCLHQLKYLHSVWSDVLPSKVCFQILGSLSNAFLEKVTHSVIKTKDLRQKTAQDLVDVFTVVRDEIPTLFPEGEVHRLVKIWMKFTSLVQILSASLMEIDDLWADGKGPFALHFHSVELKSLIRALFQDTEKRNALLSRIK